MNSNLPYPDLVAAARSLSEAWNAHATVDLNLLPYNRFNIEHTGIWWLAPTRQKAAFKFGKLLIGENHPVEQPGVVFCGLHVEKGPEYDDAKPDHKLGPDWMWHRFVKDFSSAAEVAAIRAEAVSSEPLQLHLFVWPDVAGGQHDHVQFEFAGGELNHNLSATPLDVLDGFGAVESLPELGTQLLALPNDKRDFYWIGILLGQVFTLDVDGADDTDRSIEMLRCFEQWLGDGA